MRSLLAALLASAALMATPTLAEGLADMTDAERTAFQAEVKAYLLANPEVIVEAMDVLQSREDEAAANRDQQVLADNKELIFNDGISWVGGNPDGDVTVVEFMDYRCSYCRKAYTEVEELVKSDGNIRFVLKEFPILGAESVTASRFAIAILQLHGPDAYKKAHDGLIGLRGAPDAENLGRLASEMGLDADAIMIKMASDEVSQVIATNHALADVMQISGTPTFVIDGTLLRGYVPLDGLRQIVAGERG
jgi:protein-disulfide isomerase